MFTMRRNNEYSCPMFKNMKENFKHLFSNNIHYHWRLDNSVGYVYCWVIEKYERIYINITMVLTN